MGGENWWGYCGNCKGDVDERCKAGGHKVLKDTWRILKGFIDDFHIRDIFHCEPL